MRIKVFTGIIFLVAALTSFFTWKNFSDIDRQQSPSPANTVAHVQTQPCHGTPFEQLTCYRNYYANLVKKQGIAAAMSDIRSRYEDPFIKSQCHQLTHVIGRAAEKKYASVAEAFKYGNSFCWSGYYHGILEAAVAGLSREAANSKLNSFCSEIPGKERYSFDYYNCVHGLGHGTMSVEHNDLPQALNDCDTLTGQWERQSCWSGAFMENVIADGINHFSKYLKADDPIYPCNFVDNKYRATCYLMQTSRMYTLTNGNFKEIFKLCRSSVAEPYKDICFQSLGRDASGKTISNVSLTAAICLLGQGHREQSNCIAGAARDFVAYFHGNVQALDLCNSFPENLANRCIQIVKQEDSHL